MAENIDKQTWCKDGLHGEKFHHKNVRSKWCPGYRGRNPDPIDNDSEGLSDADEPRRPSDSNRERFTEVLNDAEFRDLTDSPRPTGPPSISLPGPKRPYIHRGIGEQGRQKSIKKNPVQKAEKLYSAIKQFKLDIRLYR
jgi:hypothetical protein